jgi:hypothetical protein
MLISDLGGFGPFVSCPAVHRRSGVDCGTTEVVPPEGRHSVVLRLVRGVQPSIDCKPLRREDVRMRSWIAALVVFWGWAVWAQENPASAPAAAPSPAPSAPGLAGVFTQEEKDALAQFEDLIELHDWLGLLDRTDARHREEKLKAGVTHAQYIAELLGLFFDGNSIAGEDGKVEITDLEGIRQIAWKRKGRAEGDLETILGTVQLKDGESLLLEIRLRKSPQGGYVLSGPLG